MPKPLLRVNNLFKTFSLSMYYKVHSGWTLNPQIYIFKLTHCKCPIIAPAPKAQQCQLLSRTHLQHPAPSQCTAPVTLQDRGKPMESQGNAAAWAGASCPAAHTEWHLMQSCQRHLFLTKGLRIFGILLSF